MADQKKKKKSEHKETETTKKSEVKKGNKQKAKKQKNKKKRSCLGALFLFFFRLLLFCLLLGLIGAGILYAKYGETFRTYNREAKEAVDKSSYETFMPNETSYIYDSDGNVLAKLKRDGDTMYLSYNEIPKDVINAFIAVEDETFFTNPGFDIKGMVRVLYRYVKTKGQEAHGASTITQQLARSIFLTQEKSLERKAKEILISYYLTQKYTKEEIMEFYVNNIYFANGYYGIGAAAKGYFSKSPAELTLSETAYLCAIPNRPSYYDPFANADNALTRRDKILKNMAELSMITQKEKIEAMKETITLNHTSYMTHNYETTYAIDCAVRALMENSGFEFDYHFKADEEYEAYQAAYEEAYNDMKTELYTGGYEVYTSIDEDLQEILQNSLDSYLDEDAINEKGSDGIYAFQGAATAVDNETGKVVAIVGGRSQEENGLYSLNRAYQSRRQPGSTIKPLIVYTPAFENGYTPSSILMEISVSEANKPGTEISELKGTQYTLREAVEKSKNGCAYQLFNTIGVSHGLSYIESMRFASIVREDYTLSSALGGLTVGTTTTEMAGAYAAIADYGLYRDTTCITSIKDRNGNECYTAYSDQVYEEEAAKTMLDVLGGVMTEGTGKVLGWNLATEAVGKTGTTNDSKDGWFCGATPYYTIAVWCGYDTPRTLDSLYGGSYPGRIWKDAMEKYILGKETKTFEDPDTPDPGVLLPGRKDSELLSRGYTVGDYRKDFTIVYQVELIAKKMYTIDPNEEDFRERIETMYEAARQMIDSIYGTKAEKQAVQALKAAYGEVLSSDYVWSGNTEIEKEEEPVEVDIDLNNASSEEYLPGRQDSEVLSRGYTVGDYRSDMKLKDQVSALCDQMQALDLTQDRIDEIVEAYYEKGTELVKTIYGSKIGKEATRILDDAYKSVKEELEKNKE